MQQRSQSISDDVDTWGGGPRQAGFKRAERVVVLLLLLLSSMGLTGAGAQSGHAFGKLCTLSDGKAL